MLLCETLYIGSEWLVGLRYRDEVPSVAIMEITISAKEIDHVEFEEMTVTELKERLKVLDQ